MNHSAFTTIQWIFLGLGMALLAGALFATRESFIPMALIGLGLSAVGGGIYYFRWRSAQNEAYLRQHGQLIEAEFIKVEIDESLEVNGSNPYRVIAQWHDAQGNERRVFRSASVWFDPSSYVSARSIPVYVDPMKPSRYFMDLSFLPKQRG